MDKGWDEFVKWCKVKWPMWTPDKKSVELWLEWIKARGGVCWTIEQLSASDPAKGFYEE